MEGFAYAYLAALTSEQQTAIAFGIPDHQKAEFQELVRDRSRRDAAFRENRIQKGVESREDNDESERRYKAKKAVDLPRSWAHEDLAEVWDDAETEVRTDIGTVRDLMGVCPYGTFYSGKINGVHAESEAGKSWLLCLSGVQEINKGRHVAYVDFEDDKRSIVQRLRLLGASRDAVLTYFHYRHPVAALSEADMADFSALVGKRGSLAIFDGMTESLALEGLSDKDGPDVAAWHAKLTKPFALAGWGVVVADHIPHGEKRAIGSQHKKSAITGVSYLLDPVAPIGKGVRGVSRLKVEKDRMGWIRKHARPGRTPQYFANLVVDFSVFRAGPDASIWVAEPKPVSEDRGYEEAPPQKLREAVLAFVAKNPGCSTTAIRSGVTGANDKIDWTREWLVAHDQLRIDKGGIGQPTTHHPAGGDDQLDGDGEVPPPDPA
ncbi:hypothetical protein [Streptomyces sp. NPDC059063]|uniref:hypothetical protein n=1 Tax=unclassified Streptomyces TaxID=2593676 RepID=UPI003682E79C